MPILAKDWYDPNPDLTSFYQGDVVRDVPVVFLPDKISKWFVLRPDERSKKHVDDVLKGEICKWFESFPEGQLRDRWQYGNREEYVAAKAFLMNVAILTQTCDLEHRNYYQIAPLYPERAEKESALEHLRANDLNYAFYLPAYAPHIPENSFANLAQTSFIPKAYFPKNTVEQRLGARLTHLARTGLQEQLANYFGRPFGFGTRDTASITAEYFCVSCFYRSGHSLALQFQAGTNFTKCAECGDARWIRIVPSDEAPGVGEEPAMRTPPKE
jgi:hypothetical protein